MASTGSKFYWLSVFYFSFSYWSDFSLVESSRNLIGGFRPVDLSANGGDNEANLLLAKKLADFAAKKIDMMSNHDFWHTVTRVLSMESQLVNGMNYRVTFYEAQTDCKKRKATSHTKSCLLSDRPNASYRKCTAVVYKPFDSEQYSMGDRFQCDNVAKTEALQNSAQSNDISDNQTADQSETTYYHYHNGTSSYDTPALNYVFEKFRKLYGKTYRSFQESQKRFENFVQNIEVIKNLRKYERGTAQYGVTEFADLTYEEFVRLRTGYRRSNTTTRKAPIDALPLKDIPQMVDWRKQGAVTEVKNQGNCGSCWAFSTTGNIESVWKIKKGQLISLSEQQLVDCDKIDQGCNGGEMSDAYKEIERMGGLETESEYPYKARSAKTCQFNKTEVSVYINDSVSLPHDERQMAQYVAEHGPIAIGINAAAMMFYFGGISHPWSFTCWKRHLNHGVLIVGYGVEKQKPYWLIKNSWGPNWGESGYYRIYRGDGSCGVDQDPTSVIIK